MIHVAQCVCKEQRKATTKCIICIFANPIADVLCVCVCVLYGTISFLVWEISFLVCVSVDQRIGQVRDGKNNG